MHRIVRRRGRPFPPLRKIKVSLKKRSLFIKRHRALLTVLGALLTLGTFSFRDVLDEQYREALDDLRSDGQVFSSSGIFTSGGPSDGAIQQMENFTPDYFGKDTYTREDASRLSKLNTRVSSALDALDAELARMDDTVHTLSESPTSFNFFALKDITKQISKARSETEELRAHYLVLLKNDDPLVVLFPTFDTGYDFAKLRAPVGDWYRMAEDVSRVHRNLSIPRLELVTDIDGQILLLKRSKRSVEMLLIVLFLAGWVVGLVGNLGGIKVGTNDGD